jgi:hypothetical protein
MPDLASAVLKLSREAGGIGNPLDVVDALSRVSRYSDLAVSHIWVLTQEANDMSLIKMNETIFYNPQFKAQKSIWRNTWT